MTANNKIYLMVVFIGLANGLSGADVPMDQNQLSGARHDQVMGEVPEPMDTNNPYAVDGALVPLMPPPRPPVPLPAPLVIPPLPDFIGHVPAPRSPHLAALRDDFDRKWEAYQLDDAAAQAVLPDERLSESRRQQIEQLDTEIQQLALKKARAEGAHKAMALPRSQSQQTLLVPPTCPTCPKHEALIAKLRGDVIQAVDLGANSQLAERKHQAQVVADLRNELVEAQTENAGLKRVIRDDSSSSSHYKIRYENLQKARSFLSPRNILFGGACIAAGIAADFYLRPKIEKALKWLRNRTQCA